MQDKVYTLAEVEELLTNVKAEMVKHNADNSDNWGARIKCSKAFESMLKSPSAKDAGLRKVINRLSYNR